MTIFGNMLGGGGLAAIADGASATTGYATASVGYFGQSLAPAKPVKAAKIVSASNGFDASGLTSNIVLELYAKTGALPIHDADGVLLGSMAFTDANSTTTKVIESVDQVSCFDHVWVRCRTGVWAVFAEVTFEHPELEAPIIRVGGGRHVMTASTPTDQPLTQTNAPVAGMRICFETAEPRVVQVDAHCDFKHVGSSSTYEGVFGYGMRVQHRCGESVEAMLAAPWCDVPHAVGGGNIINRNPHHYGNKSVCSAMEIPAGFHEILVVASAHTDAAPARADIGVVHGDYNLLRVAVEPVGAVLIAM